MFKPAIYKDSPHWLKLSGYERAIWAEIADWIVNEKTGVYKSYKELVKYTGFSDKTVKTAVTGLLEAGMLLMQRTPRRNCYKVVKFWQRVKTSKEGKDVVKYVLDDKDVVAARKQYMENPKLQLKKDKVRNRKELRNKKGATSFNVMPIRKAVS